MPSFITISQSGSFKNTEKYLAKIEAPNLKKILERYGPIGVEALSNATPKNTGLTSESWYYEIVQKSGYSSINWRNRNIDDGVLIAILLQYGHGTRNGGWIEGRDYIMPAITPIFDQILVDVMKEVTK